MNLITISAPTITAKNGYKYIFNYLKIKINRLDLLISNSFNL